MCARWERTFFYFLDVPSSSGGPFLPAFDPGLPTSRECWKARNYGDPDAIAILMKRLGELVAKGLTGLDLLITWQSRHVQPLQSRVHDIWEWSPAGTPPGSRLFLWLNTSLWAGYGLCPSGWWMIPRRWEGPLTACLIRRPW